MRGGIWKQVARATATDVQRHHIMAFAAGLSYHFILSLFPALIALSAVLGLLPIPNLFNEILALMGHYVPPDSMGVVRLIVHDVVNPHSEALLSLGLIGTLWTTTSGFAGMIEALNVAYKVPETRPFWKTRLLAVLLTFFVGGLLLLALVLMVLGPKFGGWLAGTLHAGEILGHLWPVLRWVASTTFIVVAMESVYVLAPNVKQRFSYTFAGALIAVGAWLALSYALGIYFQRFANLNRTYGALGGVIALMTWLYWTSFVILLGAEVNGEVLRAEGDGTLQLKQAPSEKVSPKEPTDIAA